jgi:hypothetical protein
MLCWGTFSLLFFLSYFKQIAKQESQVIPEALEESKALANTTSGKESHMVVEPEKRWL